MDELEELLAHLEGRIEEMRELDDPLRERVFELLGGIDLLHRMALRELGRAIADAGIDPSQLRDAHPAVAWLFDAYAVDVDERAAVDAALEGIHPSVRSRVEVLEVTDGVVRLRLSGGEVASAPDREPAEIVEEALRGSFPGFVSMVVEGADDGDAGAHADHAGDGSGLLQIQPEPPEGFG